MKTNRQKNVLTEIKSGVNLRQYRQSLGLTQVQLAERLNLTPEYISMLENEKRTSMKGINMRLRLLALEPGRNGKKIKP